MMMMMTMMMTMMTTTTMVNRVTADDFKLPFNWKPFQGQYLKKYSMYIIYTSNVTGR